jgi:hypothetical protein
MYPFKKGQMVVCIRNNGYAANFLESGKRYEVAGYNDNENIKLVGIDDPLGFLDNRFELAQANPDIIE